MNTPSNENLQTFVDYIKGKRAGEQITISELGNTLLSKRQAGRLLDYLDVIGVVEKRRGGGYYLPGEGCPETILIDLIGHGPIIYPHSADEPVKIYGRVEDNTPEIRIEAYGCEISALPSIKTIPENETRRQIIQATTLIKPPIGLDDINLWILERFFERLEDDFGFGRGYIVVPANGLYILSATNVAKTSAKPVAILAYLSETSILNGFRELAETLISYERRHDEGLSASYPEVADEFFWSDYNRSVKPFVDENSDRIKKELVDKVMGLWHPKTLESKVEIPNAGVSEQPRRKKSIFESILKSLFRN